MATTSKLNDNLLLLSSKRTQNLRRSLCRFKSLKFGANSNFFGFKVGSFIPDSTSSSPINNNNVAVSLYSDSSQPPKFSLKRAACDEVKSFNLNSNSSSTNKNNAAYPFDTINKALNLLKSKVPALLMASSLMLGMMMINSHKPAMAFPGKHLFSSSSLASSSSSSLSSARGCSYCTNGCLFCLELPTRDELKSDLRPLEYLLKFGVCAFSVTFVWTMMFVAHMINSSSRSIFKIQVGLLDSEDLQRDLNFIAKSLLKCPSSAWATVLEDTVKIFDWHRKNWISGYSSGDIVWRNDAEDLFSKLSYEERNKFDKERPVHLRNVNTESLTSHIQEVDKFKNTYTVVTLLVNFRGRHKLPTIRKIGDLNRVLKKLKSYNSKTKLEGFNVFWVPWKGDEEIMSREQLKRNYPLQRPLNSIN
ncbi:hypothetical protein Q3G72_003330 [Acer saccharum]|nr:hypothetical protein Q3G72_003330 [Acer saccharum]